MALTGVALAVLVGHYISSREQLAIVKAALADSREVVRMALSDRRAESLRAYVLQGLNPHIADPERFGPSGMLRSDEAAANMAGAVPSAKEAAPVDPDERALRLAEDQWFALMESNGVIGARRDSDPA